jgi:hypothetical protein
VYYRSPAKRVLLGTGAALAIFTASTFGVLADGGSYGKGEELPWSASYSDPAAFAYTTNVAYTDAAVYQYATGDDGYAYTTSYDGAEWTGWSQIESDYTFGYEPAPVAYDDYSAVYYADDAGAYYEYNHADEAWAPVESDYTFTSAPYAAAYDDGTHFLYGVADDGYAYTNKYDGAAWSGWTALNDAAAPVKADYQVYAFTWSAKQSAFWVAEDGKAYWNRYVEGEWTGAREIEGDYAFGNSLYAVEYGDLVYAFGTSDAGEAVYNTFDGEAWSGWEAYDTAWEAAAYQPSAYIHEDVLHVAYTGANGHGWHSTYDGSAWGEWDDLGENYAYDTNQYAYDDTLYLTYTGEDGGAYYKTWEAEEKSGY